VIRTLKTYLTKELIKATLLATVALTVVMTILAVIEPLREQGLGAGQALRLLGYILPLMSSLTLPIGALFGATIVYGRFSQDNELMACRASGISTLSLLRPAVWLGVVVTVVTLTLEFYLAPALLGRWERTAKRNLEQIAYHRLKRQCYVKYSNLLFHATEVRPEEGWVIGVVGLDLTDPNDAVCLAAASAKLEFRDVGDQTIAVFYPTNPALFRQSGGTVGMAQRQGMRVGELPSMEDRPRTYSWNRLWRTWTRPEESSAVAYALEKIKRKICIQRFYERVAQTIRGTGGYELQEFAPPGGEMPPQRVEIRTRLARVIPGKEVQLGPPEPASAERESSPPQTRTVLVREYSGPRLKRELFARRANVKGVWSRLYPVPSAALVLLDVQIRYPDEAPESPRISKKEEIGPFAVSGDLVEAARGIDMAALLTDPEVRSWPEIVNEINEVRTRTVRRLLARVQAEIHQRLAYGLSCMFMIMLGAALGLVLRGGQMLVAFVISAIPATAVIVMLLMGKELIANPGVPSVYGVASIWSGVAALALVSLYIYAVPMRR
jgi:lipopolysaccharide export LptBFGC system permease protein LptF